MWTLSWIWDRLGEFWNWLEDVALDGSIPDLVVALAVLAATVAALAVIIARGRHRLVSTAGDSGSALAEEPETDREWLEVAASRAARGELREAASALYRGFLVTLEGAEVLATHGSKTPGDYATEIAANERADRRTVRRQFLASFQDLSFGRAQPSVSTYDNLSRLARDAGCPVDPTDRTPVRP